MKDTLVGITKYYPYGNCRNSTGDLGTDKLFTGQRLDDTGLYYYGARYYDPTIGRFISADVTIQNLANPQNFNRYSYCLNNPLKYTDPTGYFYEGWTVDDNGNCVPVDHFDGVNIGPREEPVLDFATPFNKEFTLTNGVFPSDTNLEKAVDIAMDFISLLGAAGGKTTLNTGVTTFSVSGSAIIQHNSHGDTIVNVYTSVTIWTPLIADLTWTLANEDPYFPSHTQGMMPFIDDQPSIRDTGIHQDFQLISGYINTPMNSILIPHQALPNYNDPKLKSLNLVLTPITLAPSNPSNIAPFTTDRALVVKLK